jgi:hypothetical protein
MVRSTPNSPVSILTCPRPKSQCLDSTILLLFLKFGGDGVVWLTILYAVSGNSIS